MAQNWNSNLSFSQLHILLLCVCVCVDKLFYYVIQKSKSWNVGCVVKWYGIINKATFKMIKLDIFQKPYVNALRALRKVRPLPSHEHYYMSNATIINYFTIFLQIVVMANYWFSFGPTTNITISISNNHFWWAFCDFSLNCLLLHQAQVFYIKELGPVQLQLTLVQPTHKLCPVFRNFSHMPMAGEVATKELWQISAIKQW